MWMAHDMATETDAILHNPDLTNTLTRPFKFNGHNFCKQTNLLGIFYNLC